MFIGKNAFVFCLGAVALCVGAGVARAGYKQWQPVVLGANYAEGSMGSTRNSLNTTDYIGCSFSSKTSSAVYSGECSVRVGTTTKTCQFDSNELELFLESMRNMTADSWIHFEWNPTTMVCTKMDVWVASGTEVKAP
jgi:hypothetical protein